MGKLISFSLKTVPKSNESFVLLGGPMKKMAKSKSDDGEEKKPSKPSSTHGEVKPEPSGASPTSDSPTED